MEMINDQTKRSFCLRKLFTFVFDLGFGNIGRILRTLFFMDMAIIHVCKTQLT